MTKKQNYYRLLNVEKTANADTIKKAFRQKALENHPDTKPAEEKQEFTERMKEIIAAYEVLSNPKLRMDYDRDLVKKQELQQKHKTEKAQKQQHNPWKNHQASEYWNNKTWENFNSEDFNKYVEEHIRQTQERVQQVLDKLQRENAAFIEEYTRRIQEESQQLLEKLQREGSDNKTEGITPSERNNYKTNSFKRDITSKAAPHPQQSPRIYTNIGYSPDRSAAASKSAQRTPSWWQQIGKRIVAGALTLVTIVSGGIGIGKLAKNMHSPQPPAPTTENVQQSNRHQYQQTAMEALEWHQASLERNMNLGGVASNNAAISDATRADYLKIDRERGVEAGTTHQELDAIANLTNGKKIFEKATAYYKQEARESKDSVASQTIPTPSEVSAYIKKQQHYR